MSIEGKIALVTGASRGMGAEIAVALAAAGADVALAARTVEAGDVASETRPGTVSDVARRIEALGRRALPVRADVSERSDVESLVETVIAKFGRIDILVNSAWYVQFSETMLSDLLDVEMMDATIGVYRGLLDCTRLVLPHMRENKSGTIINVTSIGAKNKTPLSPVYGSLKAGVAHFTSCVAAAVAADGVRVNCVAPGIIDTASSYDCLPNSIEIIRTTRIPMQRLGAESDIAKAAVFLADDETSGYITGTTLTVDGGFSQF